jgi:hypothetical protein
VCQCCVDQGGGQVEVSGGGEDSVPGNGRDGSFRPSIVPDNAVGRQAPLPQVKCFSSRQGHKPHPEQGPGPRRFNVVFANEFELSVIADSKHC